MPITLHRGTDLATLHRGTALAQPSPDTIQTLEAAELLALTQRAYPQDPSFNPSAYTLRGQLYYLDDKIYVPNALDARTHVIYQCRHAALTAGHFFYKPPFFLNFGRHNPITPLWLDYIKIHYLS